MQVLLVHLLIGGQDVLAEEPGDWVALILELLGLVALGDGLESGRRE